MYHNNYHYIQSNCTVKLQCSALSTNTILITVLHVENGAKFLNETYAWLAAFFFIFPVTKINASE